MFCPTAPLQRVLGYSLCFLAKLGGFSPPVLRGIAAEETDGSLGILHLRGEMAQRQGRGIVSPPPRNRAHPCGHAAKGCYKAAARGKQSIAPVQYTAVAAFLTFHRRCFQSAPWLEYVHL